MCVCMCACAQQRSTELPDHIMMLRIKMQRHNATRATPHQHCRTTSLAAMSWFRSEEMQYASLAVDKDSAHKVVHRLGRIGAMQFIDVSVRGECTVILVRCSPYFVTRREERERAPSFVCSEEGMW